MEKFLLNAPQQTEMKILNSLYAKMVLDKALRDFRIEQILKEIDKSLQYRNKEKFLRLTEELNFIS
ncbi:IDEAL domain-containing protein [Metabacillus herbersteinensis]|uniref:IDEAL domain-containing protein n=1 Tax=Metabacillus herbersteinensis TaxID=283816 RepID=A0ABV6GDI5_9BACI